MNNAARKISATREVLVLNTNALFALAHASALKASGLLSDGSTKNHKSRLRRLAKSIVGELEFEGGSRKAVEISDRELPWPRSWHYSRNVYTQVARRSEDSNHASYDLDLLSLMADGDWTAKFLGEGFQKLTREQVQAFVQIFLNNIVIRNAETFLPYVCINDMDRKEEDSTRRWMLPSGASADYHCPDGFSKVSTFYDEVTDKTIVSSTGRARRSAWGWLEIGKDDPQVISIFQQLFSGDFLPITGRQTIEGVHRYERNTLYLLARLGSILADRSKNSKN